MKYQSSFKTWPRTCFKRVVTSLPPRGLWLYDFTPPVNIWQCPGLSTVLIKRGTKGKQKQPQCMLWLQSLVVRKAVLRPNALLNPWRAPEDRELLSESNWREVCVLSCVPQNVIFGSEILCEMSRISVRGYLNPNQEERKNTGGICCLVWFSQVQLGSPCVAACWAGWYWWDGGLAKAQNGGFKNSPACYKWGTWSFKSSNTRMTFWKGLHL